jgi:alpha-beta hydrolase superfamily lysophospholipase
LSFGSFNKAFKPNRTAFDWLSRDPGGRQVHRRPAVRLPLQQPAVARPARRPGAISQASNLAQIDPHLPLLVIGGECDPVSEGKRLTDLAAAMRAPATRRATADLSRGAARSLQRNQSRRGHP